MKRTLRIITLFLIFLVILIISPVQAYIGLCCAHCGGNMPLNVPGGGIPEPHEFRIKMSQMFMRMGPLINGTSDESTDGLLGSAADGLFMAVPESMDMNMTMFSLAYSFSDDFALMGMASYKWNSMPMKFNSMMQTKTGNAGFTMDSNGIGDIKLMGKYRIFTNDTLAPTNQLSGIFGVSIPTGRIDERFDNHPDSTNNGRFLPYKMQLGSGTFDPIMGLTYQGSIDPFWYGTNFLYYGRFYDNEEGYHQGNEVRLDFYSMYQFHQKSLVHLQLNGYYEGKYSDEPDAQKINGDGHRMFKPSNGYKSPLFDPNNYGGTRVNITTGLQFQPIPLHIIEINASKPLYQNLRGPQLAEDYRVMLSYYIEIPTSKSRRYVGTKPPKELGF